MTNQMLQLTAAIASQVGQMTSPDSAIQSALAALVQAAQRAKCQPFETPSHDYAELVASALANAPSSAIATSLLRVHRLLPWVYHYARSADDDLGARIAFAELIGPDGPTMAPRCRIGFTVMADRTMYPMHAHPAVELYLVVTGHAQWLTPTSDRILPPGELVLHRSNEPHAMRTFDEPLLALWGWTGNIDAPAMYL